jgi:hypothetical protein
VIGEGDLVRPHVMAESEAKNTSHNEGVEQSDATNPFRIADPWCSPDGFEMLRPR